ncbi:MAG: AzlD domain-containing protein [Clostridia bacterium]|nr:AzlD domain-containing protein [Clostridia bacterium]
MSKLAQMFILLFAMAGITYLIRMLPLVFFRKKIKSKYIKSLLFYIPYAVLSAMTFPFILYDSTGNFSFALVIGTIVALIAAAFRLSLIIVAVLSCAAVFIAVIL